MNVKFLMIHDELIYIQKQDPWSELDNDDDD